MPPKKDASVERKALPDNPFRGVREQHTSEIAEDYVEVIADLIGEKGEARAVDLAKRLGVTHVTVIRTIARLQKAGLVKTEPYRSIFLTSKGGHLAAACKARHQLILRFLCELGIPEEIARQDAEGIEHHVSRQTLKAMEAFVDGKY
jgi:DtxR family manganese transport transcriptional regulator